jgi:zinc transporter ZupT
MIGFAETFGATLVSFVVPAFVGLFVISIAARYVGARYLAAFAIGLYLWFFSDTISGASYMAVDEGFTGGIFHVLLWVVFAAGLILMFSLDRGIFSQDDTGPRLAFVIPLLVAFAVGVHGFAEGATIGATAATAPNGDLLAAFGGEVAGLAFVIHKALEPMMVGAAYWIYAKDRAKTSRDILRDFSILVAAFALPGIIGCGIAYYLVQIYPTADFTYVYAFGVGSSIYALARLSRPLFRGSQDRWDTLKVALFLMLGFTCLYVAALLHS